MKGVFPCHCSVLLNIYQMFIVENDLEHKSDKSSIFLFLFLCRRYASFSGSNEDVLCCSVESLNVHKLICVCVESLTNMDKYETVYFWKYFEACITS